MSRVSYEGNNLIIMQEGLSRTGFYYHEARLCTINTENTISTIIQKDINQNRLYRKTNLSWRS